MRSPSVRPLLALLSLLLGCCLAQEPAVPEGALPEDLVERGRRLCSLHEWPAAITVLSDALRGSPNSIEALRWRGHAYTGSEQPALARADLERALALGADDAWTHYAHATSLHHLGHFAQSIDGYTRALQIDPTFHKAHEWRGYTSCRIGRYLAAIPDLDAALQFDPGNPNVHLIRGKARAYLLDFGSAEEDLWRAYDAHQDDGDCPAQLAYVLVVNRQPGRARWLFEEALSKDPSRQVECRLWLHHLFAHAGDAAEAEAQLASLLALAAKGPAPRDNAPVSDLHWAALLARFLKGEVPLDEVLHVAAEQSPGSAPDRKCAAYLHSALIELRRGHKKEALAELARAVATNARDQWEWAWAWTLLREVCGEL